MILNIKFKNIENNNYKMVVEELIHYPFAMLLHYTKRLKFILDLPFNIYIKVIPVYQQLSNNIIHQYSLVKFYASKMISNHFQQQHYQPIILNHLEQFYNQHLRHWSYKYYHWVVLVFYIYRAFQIHYSYQKLCQLRNHLLLQMEQQDIYRLHQYFI